MGGSVESMVSSDSSPRSLRLDASSSGGYPPTPSPSAENTPFRRTGSERLKDGAKALLRRMESIRSSIKRKERPALPPHANSPKGSPGRNIVIGEPKHNTVAVFAEEMNNPSSYATESTDPEQVVFRSLCSSSVLNQWDASREWVEK
ncbi:unnamed protein product [Cyprideis torosa]|uniref:Uncharacterized protein n=1 Tax=Cyprideis torosa TaxID=163714 RepID=A0A7R8ZPQ1_9CRUS|nr:unnamed protein product [Cyprideis torosa]CAG0888801.1 unnamed protein product [Cyprideis torosa]